MDSHEFVERTVKLYPGELPETANAYMLADTFYVYVTEQKKPAVEVDGMEVLITRRRLKDGSINHAELIDKLERGFRLAGYGITLESYGYTYGAKPRYDLKTQAAGRSPLKKFTREELAALAKRNAERRAAAREAERELWDGLEDQQAAENAEREADERAARRESRSDDFRLSDQRGMFNPNNDHYIEALDQSAMGYE